MKKFIQIGAGNIGRGFLGQLFYESGYEIVFIDINEEIISKLNKDKFYKIQIIGENQKEIIVTNVRGILSSEKQKVKKEFLNVDVVGVSVGVNALKFIVPLLYESLYERYKEKIYKSLNIIVCENLLNSGEYLRNLLMSKIKDKTFSEYIDKYIGFVDAVVSRMIPILPDEIKKNDLTLIRVEEYCILPVNKKAIKLPWDDIKGIKLYDNLYAYEELKLYIHNLGHSCFAYFGFLKNYRYIWESVEDKEIYKKVINILNKIAEVLIKRHNFHKKEVNEYVSNLIKRFSNKLLGDTVYRVGREPIRKLSPNDRFIGGLKLLKSYGIESDELYEAIALALNYNYKDDSQAHFLCEMLNEKGIEFVLQEVCGLNPKDEVGKNIIDKYRKVKRSGSL